MVPKGYWSVTSHVIWRLCPNLGSEIPPRPSTSRQPRPTSTDLAQPRNLSTDFGDFDLRPELTIFWAEVARGPARSQISNRHPPRDRYHCEHPHGGVKSRVTSEPLPRHPGFRATTATSPARFPVATSPARFPVPRHHPNLEVSTLA